MLYMRVAGMAHAASLAIFVGGTEALAPKSLGSRPEGAPCGNTGLSYDRLNCGNVLLGRIDTAWALNVIKL